MNTPVYLDYNATTPLDHEVVNEMLPFIHTHFGNPFGSYAIGRHNREAINRARGQVAGLINAKPEEIIFTSGGTESNNHAIRGIAFANKEKRKHIITMNIEHPAVTGVCRYLASMGWDITYLPVDRHGKVNPKDVKHAILQDTVLITIMHANNEVGTIQPLEEIGNIAKKHRVIFHTDAAQSVGKIEVDVQKFRVDLLSIGGHKLYAPIGIGALYIRQGTKMENLIYGAGQEKGIRPGTENVPYIVALTIAFEKVEAHTLASLINKEVLLSTGSACHADSVETSSVLKAMNIDPFTAAGTVRISTGKFTTDKEIDRAIFAISDKVLKLIS